MVQPSQPDDFSTVTDIVEVVEKSPQLLAIRFGIPSAILVLALFLRLWGITWGLPNQQRVLSYHPDEGVNLVSGVLDEGQPRPHLDLKFYHYGALYFYAWQGSVAINRSYGAIKLPATGQPDVNIPDSTAAMILVGRLLTVLCGVLTVGFLMVLGQRMFHRNVGLLAALIYAIIPAAVVNGHYATVDVPATLMITLALLAGYKLRGQSSIKSIVIAGIVCGLASAAKYNALLVVFAPAYLLLSQTEIKLSNRLRNLAVLGGFTLIGFIVGCFGAVLNFESFKHDFLFELTKSSQGMGLLFADTGNGILYTITNSFRYGMGIPMFCLFGIALVWAGIKKTPEDKFLLSYFVLYFLVIGFSKVHFLRYIVPLSPVAAILIARVIVYNWTGSTFTRAIRFGSVVVIGITLLNSLAMDSVMTKPDPRDTALEYVLQKYAGQSIGFVTTPWYYTPPISPLFTAPSPGQRKQAALERQSNRMILPEGEWDKAVLDQSPDIFVVSDIESVDALRIGLPASAPFIKRWVADYKAVTFENMPEIWGVNFGKPGNLPNDWLYTIPTITIYVRKI